LSTKLLAYNIPKDASSLLHHILCIMCIQVLGDVRVGMSKASCNIDRLCPSLDQLCRMCVPEAMGVETCFTQNKRDGGMMERYAVRTYADERAALENTQGIDVVLKEIINLQNGKQGGVLLADYDSLLKGYDLLKEGKIEQAHAELDKIPLNSPVRQIALALKHYGGNK